MIVKGKFLRQVTLNICLYLITRIITRMYVRNVKGRKIFEKIYCFSSLHTTLSFNTIKGYVFLVYLNLFCYIRKPLSYLLLMLIHEVVLHHQGYHMYRQKLMKYLMTDVKLFHYHFHYYFHH